MGRHRPKLVHVSVTRRFGGVYEVVAGDLRELARRDMTGDWVVTATQGATGRRAALLLQHALSGGCPEDFPVDDIRRALVAFRSHHEARIVAAASGSDAIILHDPMCAVLIPALKETSARVVWRCHLGCADDAASKAAQLLLQPFVKEADMVIFSRPAAVWPGLAGDERVAIVPPGIDGETWKNRELSQVEADALWVRLWAQRNIRLPTTEEQTTALDDGGTGGLAQPDVPFVLQVSRWDHLKGHMGVLRGFSRLARLDPDLELVLVGPYIDDRRNYPTNRQVWRELMDARALLSPAVAGRVHVWQFAFPRSDAEDLALNLLRRKARTVVQNSVLEGFGLTVAEAMWQRAVVVGSAVGGIVEQIEHEVNGLLTTDTDGGEAWVTAVRHSLTDDASRSRWRAEARRTVRERYLVADAVGKQLALLGLNGEGRTSG